MINTKWQNKCDKANVADALWPMLCDKYDMLNAMGKLQRDKYNMTNTICQKNYKCNVTNAMW